MRQMTTAAFLLIGLATLISIGGGPNLRASAQTSGVFWINDSYTPWGGQGIYELTTSGKLKLLIPTSQVERLDLTQSSLESYVGDIALDSQGQIFLHDPNGQQILKATLEGDLSLAAWLPDIAFSSSMGIDAQGNFIIAQFYPSVPLLGIYRVSPDGVTRLVAHVPPCPNGASYTDMSFVIDKSGDYIVAAVQASGNALQKANGGEVTLCAQIVRMTPSGETTVMADVNSNPLIRDVYYLVLDPTGQGYYATAPASDSGIIHISPTGQVTSVTGISLQQIKGNINGMSIGPMGDLILGAHCFGDSRPDCRVGIYEIALDGSRVQVLYEASKRKSELVSPGSIQWIPK